MIENSGSWSASRCGIAPPTALKRASFPIFTSRQRDRELSAGVARRRPKCLWVIFLFTGFVFHPKIATAQNSQSPPSVMHFCAANCFTLTWDHGHYVNTTGFDWNPQFRSIWTVESFTHESVILHRTDTGRFPLTAVYTGQISKESNSLINVTVNGSPTDANKIRLTWGTALSSTPGSNAERNRGQQQQRQTSAEEPQYKTSSANQPLGNLPRVMRFCAFACFTLTLSNGHYNAVREDGADRSVSSIYTVVSFTPDSIVLNRSEMNGRTAVLTGKMSSQGSSVVDGKITWDGTGGTFPYQLTWGDALATAEVINGQGTQQRTSAQKPQYKTGSAVGDYLYDAVAKEMAKPQPKDIQLPPGASPAFASFPDDMRAVLQPESPLIPSEAKLPCDSSREVTAVDALEIGKFAYRAADFSRGYCWIKRSADMGNLRATVILGVSALMGWGVPKDPGAGVSYFKQVADTRKDPWGVYFLKQCYEYGVGTPVDKQMAAHLDFWLMTRSAGQAVYWSIGADDAEQRRRYERGLLLLMPPMKKHTECHVALGHNICSDVEEIDQDELNRQLGEIGH